MRILKFEASWCGPCKQLQEVIEEAGVEVDRVDVDSHKAMVKDYRIRGVPTLVFLDWDGNEVKRIVGLINKTQLLGAVNDLS